MGDEVVVSVETAADLVAARQKARQTAAALGFKGAEPTLIATAISELTRNILQYSGSGTIRIRGVARGRRQGIEITACDQGPGIADVALALQDGYSTSGGLGLGLPGVQRLMDEFEIESSVGRGTKVKTTKWIGS